MIFLQVLAIDINRKYFDLGFPVFQKTGVAHKIDFREGLALSILDEILEKVTENTINLRLHAHTTDFTLSYENEKFSRN